MRDNIHEEFMRLAIGKAKKGIDAGQTPFGACLVKDGEVISCRHNSVWGSADITAHAEMNVIREACKKLKTIDLSGCILYSTCEPCPMCLAAIYWARLERVYYALTRQDAAAMGFDDALLYTELSLPIGKRKLPLHPLARDAALRAVREWNNKPDRTLY